MSKELVTIKVEVELPPKHDVSIDGLKQAIADVVGAETGQTCRVIHIRPPLKPFKRVTDLVGKKISVPGMWAGRGS